MTKALNKAAVEALPAPAKGNKITYFAGAIAQGVPAPRGFGVRVTAAGARSFVLNYHLGGRERRYTIGQYPEWSALDAVREARKLRQRVDKGEDPLEDRAPPAPVVAPRSVADVIEEHIKRHVSGLRTSQAVERALRHHVLPVIGAVPLYDLRRRHLAEMLDRVEDEAGPVAASRVVAYVSKAFNWWATRDDEFTSPMIRGMARSNPRERARTRTLSDDEVRAIWTATDEADTFGALVRMLLLTAQRRGEVAGMRRAEVAADGTWTIPAARYKTKREHVVPLSAAALDLIAARPTGDLLFGSEVGTAFTAYAKPKDRLDAASGVTDWRLHDLRRTAKTLMMRAGVRPDVSERVLGHTIAGVEGVYDRHSYLDEKRHALAALGAEVGRIIDPPPAVVVPLRPAASASQ